MIVQCCSLFQMASITLLPLNIWWFNIVLSYAENTSHELESVGTKYHTSKRLGLLNGISERRVSGRGRRIWGSGKPIIRLIYVEGHSLLGFHNAGWSSWVLYSVNVFWGMSLIIMSILKWLHYGCLFYVDLYGDVSFIFLFLFWLKLLSW